MECPINSAIESYNIAKACMTPNPGCLFPPDIYGVAQGSTANFHADATIRFAKVFEYTNTSFTITGISELRFKHQQT